MTTEVTAAERGFALENSPSHLLHRAQQFAADRTDALKSLGLTLRQFAVLAAVDERAGCSQSDLVKATGIDRSTLAEMVKRMADKGLLERRQDKLDGRAKSLFMTEEGTTAFRTAAPLVRSADDTILATLPRNRQNAFVSVLAVLANAADNEEADGMEDEPDDGSKPKKGKKASTPKDKDKPKKKRKKKKK